MSLFGILSLMVSVSHTHCVGQSAVVQREIGVAPLWSDEVLLQKFRVNGGNTRSSNDNASIFPDRLGLSLLLSETEQLDMNLKKTNTFDYSNIKVTVDNGKSDPLSGEHLQNKNVGFYYDEESRAVFSVTEDDGGRQVTGTFYSDGRYFEMEPTAESKMKRGKRFTSATTHVVREVTLPPMQETEFGTIDRPPNSTTSARRSKRAVNYSGPSTARRFGKNIPLHAKKPVDLLQNNFYVDLIFLLDYSIYQYWLLEHRGDHQAAIASIKYYYVHLYHGIYTVYSAINIKQHGYRITPWLNEIRIVTTVEQDKKLVESYDRGSRMDLLETEQLLFDYMDDQDLNWDKIDAVVFFSRRIMEVSFSPGGNLEEILGLASDVCAVCELALCEVHDYGLFSWATAAHELGHLLGAHHDGTENDCDPDKNNLMTPRSVSLAAPTYKNIFKFSTCSIEMMQSCFQGKKYRGKRIFSTDFPRVCVYDTICSHGHPVSDYLDELPGQIYDLNQQCELSLGIDGVKMSTCAIGKKDICRSLRCDIPRGDRCTNGGNLELRAYAGTPCDVKDPNKVCFQGECVALDSLSYSATEEPANSCPMKDCFVPEECKNSPQRQMSGVDCGFVALVWPDKCFNEDFIRTNCQASCFKLGLHSVQFPVCSIRENNPCYDKNMDNYVNDSLLRPGRHHFTYCANDVQFGRESGWRVQCPGYAHTCVEMKAFCDGTIDCPDELDELEEFCDGVPSGVVGYVRCPGTPDQLILTSRVCDKRADCPGATDETQRICSQFIEQCHDSGRSDGDTWNAKYNCPDRPEICLSAYQFCDDWEDCPTGADEADEICSQDYTFTEAPLETTEELEPTTESVLVSTPKFFNVCTEYTTQEGDWMIQCPNDPSVCIPVWWACDDVEDCPLAADEEPDFCRKVPSYKGWVRCLEDPFEIIHWGWLCDEESDCQRGEDENQPWCNAYIVYCEDGFINCPDQPEVCIPESCLCDGMPDCSLGAADEDKEFCRKWRK